MGCKPRPVSPFGWFARQIRCPRVERRGVAMRRREFITLVAGASAWPMAARAQQPPSVVGFLNTTSPDTYAFNAEAFRKGLGTLGYVEGKNVAIEYRWASGNYSRMPALAKELVNRNVSVIAATGDVVSAQAAQTATATIPIVFAVGSDPVRYGLVKSLNSPGGNLTGVTLFSSTLMAKRMDLLTQLVPNARVIALLMNPDNSNAETDITGAQKAAGELGRQTVVVNARNEREFDAAFAAMKEQRADAALIASDPMLLSQRTAIATLATRHAIPIVYWGREFVAAGGLISYGTGVTWMYHQVGVYCGRILKGAKIAELPVLQPTQFDLVLNMKTAKALNLAIPPHLLATADEVIE
jgi:putative tryptophan/tyrosine transport system substrate-binding protein